MSLGLVEMYSVLMNAVHEQCVASFILSCGFCCFPGTTACIQKLGHTDKYSITEVHSPILFLLFIFVCLFEVESHYEAPWVVLQRTTRLASNS